MLLNVNLYWGNTRVPMDYLSWTDFNARLRFWQNYIGRPLAFSVYGQQQIYIGPVPDQVYQIEDRLCCFTFTINVYLHQMQQILLMILIQNLLNSMRLILAKYYEQSFGEAEIFKQEYLKTRIFCT
jgi:hypothetical protein